MADVDDEIAVLLRIFNLKHTIGRNKLADVADLPARLAIERRLIEDDPNRGARSHAIERGDKLLIGDDPHDFADCGSGIVAEELRCSIFPERIRR